LATSLTSPAAAAAPTCGPTPSVGRSGAHLFYWLYGCTGCANRETAPWTIWLQGGPGAGGSGYGNFGEMGPLDLTLQPRNQTWVNASTIVYVDSPVGAGYSYVDTPAAYTTNNTQIAADLITFVQALTAKFPELTTAPLFVFSESYGGKMNAGFAQALLAAVAAGQVKVNLRGIALGDSWIAGQAYVDTWGPYLVSTSLMDAHQLALMNVNVAKCDAAVAAGQWAQATNLWGTVEDDVENYAAGVNFYNILQWVDPLGTDGELQAKDARRPRLSAAARALVPEGVDADVLDRLYGRHMSVYLADPVTDLMNGAVKAQLGSIIPASECLPVRGTALCLSACRRSDDI
jgi:serine carboxypeptidase 1